MKTDHLMAELEVQLAARRERKMGEMTPEQRIDAALDSVLRASGSSLKHHATPDTLTAMRKAMRKIMSDSYIKGSNDCHKTLTGGWR